MGKYKEFNINHYFKVNLKDCGVNLLNYNTDLLNDEFDLELPYKKPEDDGMYKFQAWQFMQIFGHTCGLGFQEYFDTNILIEFNNE